MERRTGQSPAVRLLAAAGALLLALPIADVARACVDYGDGLNWLQRVEVPGEVRGMIAVDDLIYVINNGGLLIYDVGTLAAPELLGGIGTPGEPVALAVRPGLACVMLYAYHDYRLVTIDIADPVHLSVVGSVNLPDLGFEVALWGDLAFVADYRSGLQVVSIADPAQPALIGGRSLPGKAKGVAVNEGRIYVAGDSGCGLQILDAADPHMPDIVGALAIPWASNIAVRGDHAYVTMPDSLIVVDVSDPAQPVRGRSVPAPGDEPIVQLSGDLAFVMAHPYLIPLSGGGQAMVPALNVYDISAPSTPAWIGGLAGTGNGLAVAGNRVYYSSSLSGFNIGDFTNPHSVPLVASYSAEDDFGHVGSITRVLTAHGLVYLGISAPDGWPPYFIILDTADPLAPAIVHQAPGEINDMVIDGGFLYRVGSNSLAVYDLVDPAHPQLRGIHSFPAIYAHQLDVSGGYAYVAAEHDGLRIVDVSNPDAPFLVGSFDHPSSNVRALEVVGDFAFIADGIRGLMVVDVANPSAPAYVAEVSAGGPLRRVLPAGDLLYGAGEDGLRVYDISNPTAPALVTSTQLPGEGGEMNLAGGLLYVCCGTGVKWWLDVQVFDVSEPTTPQRVGTIHTGGSCEIALDASHLYVAAFEGLRIAERQCPAVSGIGPSGDLSAAPQLSICPNPFNPATTIHFSLADAQSVRLAIFDVRGRLVQTMLTGPVAPGDHDVIWKGVDAHGRPLPSGAYFCRLEAGREVQTRSLSLVR